MYYDSIISGDKLKKDLKINSKSERNNNMGKRLISLVIAVLMISTVYAAPVFAEIVDEDYRWSNWSCEEPPEGSDLEQVKKYRYRIETTSEEGIPSFDRWSAWTEKADWETVKNEIEKSLKENQSLDIETVTIYRYKLPLLEQVITGPESFVKTCGENPFALNAEAPNKLTYESSDNSIAEVSADGTVTIKKGGNVIITITAEKAGDYNSAKKEVTIKINKKKQDIIGSTGISKTYGTGSFLLKMKAKTSLSYKSSNTKIVTVSSAGKVIMKNPGTATITVKAGETGWYKPAEKKVKITVKLRKPVITTSYKKSSRMVYVKWKSVPGADKYQVYRYNYGKKKYTLDYTATSKAKGCYWTGKKGKTYKCKVRAYKVVNGKKVYSDFSNVKSVKAK